MWIRHVVALLALAVAACAGPEVPQAPPAPVEPQPTAAQLRPGLLPLYFYAEYQSVDEMPSTPAELAKGIRGKPVAELNANSNAGKLWEAQTDVLYGVHFTGLIRLPAGETRFAVRSNDGTRVTLDRARILDDPDPHPTRLTPPARVNIAAAGWYRLTVQYFQKRGAAALELYWQPPGASALGLVPADVLAHQP